MTAHPFYRLLGRVGWVLGTFAALGTLVGTGYLVPTRPLIAAGAAIAVLALGLTLAEPAVIPLLAVPVLLVVHRVGGANINLSLSDVALFMAFWPAVFLAKRPYSHTMRTLLWLCALYQTATLFTVVANPYRANLIEWFHALFLVAGALVVGWAIGRQGHARLGLSLFLITAGLLAADTLVQGITQYLQGFSGPVYVRWPYPMHKNFTGTVFGLAAIIAYCRPLWLGWKKKWTVSFFWLFVVGILFCQSRQALIGLGAALVFIVMRTDPDRRRSKIIVLAIAPAMALIGITVKEQVESGNEFNSTLQRLTWFQDSLNVWSHDPIFGVGLRWWYTDRFDVRFQPPNAEMEVLTSAGVVGVVAFLALMVGAVIVLLKLDARFGTVAVAVLISRLSQTQFDLFWVAAQTSIPFLIVGIALGTEAVAREDEAVPAIPERHQHPAPVP